MLHSVHYELPAENCKEEKSKKMCRLPMQDLLHGCCVNYVLPSSGKIIIPASISTPQQDTFMEHKHCRMSLILYVIEV